MSNIFVRAALASLLVMGSAPALAQSVSLDQVVNAPGGRTGFGGALSMRGDRALVGAAGAAVLCQVDAAGVWSCPAATLSPFGGEDSTSFGTAVELGDGYAFVGAPNADVVSGAVYVFEEGSGGTWTGTQRLTETPRDTYNDGAFFGERLEAEGTTLVANAYYYDRDNPLMGRVVVFERDGSGSYSQSLMFGAPYAGIGYQTQWWGMALDFDGTRILSAELWGGAGGTSTGGSAFVFDYAFDGDTGSIAERRGYNGSSYGAPCGLPSVCWFARAVRFADGEIILGDEGATVGGLANAGGLVIVNEESGADLGHFYMDPPVANARLGFRIAWDGDWIAAASQAGVAQIYYRSAAGWIDVGQVDDGGTQFGSTVAIRGRTLLVGDPQSFGRVYVYHLSPAPQANGMECRDGAECTSGQCADGVCCNVACDGICTSCIAAETGGTDGTCAPIPAGQTDVGCDSACNACDGAGTCDPMVLCDAGMPDAGVDAGMPDGGTDAGMPDGGTDGGPVTDTDAGSMADAGVRTDAGRPGRDAGETGSDAGGGDMDASVDSDAGGTVPRIDASCVCGMTAPSRTPTGLLFAGLALVLAYRRRRR